MKRQASVVHRLPIPVCPKISDHCGVNFTYEYLKHTI